MTIDKRYLMPLWILCYLNWGGGSEDGLVNGSTCYASLIYMAKPEFSHVKKPDAVEYTCNPRQRNGNRDRRISRSSWATYPGVDSRNTTPCLKQAIKGAGETAQQLRPWLLLHRIQVPFPASSWHLSAIYIILFQGISSRLRWGLGLGVIWCCIPTSTCNMADSRCVFVKW